MTVEGSARPLLQRQVALAALAVLVFANAVGVWLAGLLLWPRLGELAGPLTYGRWVPVHLNLQLYGWCSLPVIGLLLARFLPAEPRPANAAAPVALAVWCGALTAGVIAWLSGRTSGKIFLDWAGPAGLAFTFAQLFLWSVLAAGWWTRLRPSPQGNPIGYPNRPPAAAGAPAQNNLIGYSIRRAGGDGALLVALLGVPIALFLVAQPSVYPPVNPQSGGATGHSLLASSLGIVGIALALPVLLGRPAARRERMRGATISVLIGFAMNLAAYMLIEHGNVSHHVPTQIAGLATLLAWPMALVWWFRHFTWARAHRRWLFAAAAWAALLVVDGFVLFLPGVLERTKFTNAFVAHTHLAMAGLLTSLNLLMLISLAPDSRLAAALAARRTWLAWNAACLAMIVVLTALGWTEGAAPRLIADNGAGVGPAYFARLIAGLAMLAVSVRWLQAAGQSSAPP